jgi:predicted nucleic acid-binding protein
MSIYILDSSALVKRYVPEAGTRWIRSICAPSSGHQLFIAQITIPETYAAISRLYYDQHISQPVLHAFRKQLMYHAASQYHIFDLTPLVVQTALDLNERHRLRAYDAVQLATAMILSQRAKSLGQTVTFLCADNRLLQAAQTELMPVDNPNNHT